MNYILLQSGAAEIRECMRLLLIRKPIQSSFPTKIILAGVMQKEQLWLPNLFKKKKGFSLLTSYLNRGGSERGAQKLPGGSVSERSHFWGCELTGPRRK